MVISCGQNLEKQRKTASLESDSSTLSQTLKPIQQERISLSYKSRLSLFLKLLLVMGCLFSPISFMAADYDGDVEALRSLYASLGNPTSLLNWNFVDMDPDPCDNWDGVECSHFSVISIDLHDRGLSGTLSGSFHMFQNLTTLDLSMNRLSGDIPHGLPPRATYINFGANNLVGPLPKLMSELTDLQVLNLSHNELDGPIEVDFSNLQQLLKMDISYNRFSGVLPNSFRFLINLNAMFLQYNQFSGSIAFLEPLHHLKELDITNNHFTGPRPKFFDSIPDLGMRGNSFDPASLPHRPERPGRERLGTEIIILTVLGVVFIVMCIAVIGICIFYHLQTNSSGTESRITSIVELASSFARLGGRAGQPPRQIMEPGADGYMDAL